MEKIWNDADDADKIRPKEIQVQLYADDVPYGVPVTLNDTYGWSHKWTELDQKKDGVDIVYKVDEVKVPDEYSKVITGSASVGYIITNTHVPEYVVARVVKVWEDADDQDGIRPATLEVELLADGNPLDPVKTLTLTESDGWSEQKIENLPKYRFTVNEDGTVEKEEIEYTWTEREVPKDYELSGNTTDGELTTITNKHVPKVIDVTVRKVWDDAGNQDGERPDTLKVILLADGNDSGMFVELFEGNGWSDTITNLPMNKEGKAIVYSWSEADLPEGYSLTGEVTEGYVTTLTNSHTPGKTSVSVRKFWDDSDNKDLIRPESITVRLTANGEAYGEDIILNEEKEWKYIWTELDEKKAGVKITYEVDEVRIPDEYTKVVTGDASTGYIITNTHVPEFVEASVVKVWDDADDQDGIRPATLEVELLADGNPLDPEKTVKLTEDDGWAVKKIENLPKYSFSIDSDWNVTKTLISYTWGEKDLPEGYTLTGTQVEGTLTTLTNTHEPAKVSVSVQKIWDDSFNKDEIRPEEIKVQLTADGVEYGGPVTLSDTYGWTYTWTELDERKAGELIRYSVDEISVPDEYTKVVTGDASTGYIITNTHVPEFVEASVVKVWDDADDQDGIRPATLDVELLADGESLDEPIIVTLTSEDGWAEKKIENLPKYRFTADEDGRITKSVISYSWAEKNVPEGYTLTGDTTEGTLTTLSNSHAPAKTEVSVEKIWIDDDNNDGIRPAEIAVQLKADGKNFGEPVILSKSNGWTYTWTELDERKAGVTIVYTVDEVSVPEGYVKVITGDASVGYVITNAHDSELIEVTVIKSWDDANNQDGIRPEKLVVALRADGKNTGLSVELSDENNWTGTISGLLKIKNGKLIEYSWSEKSLPSGYSLTGTVTDGYVTTITNSYTPKQISIRVEKQWRDDDDRDGLRPESIHVQLKANGASYGRAIELSEANGWKYTWTGLPENRLGRSIEYSVEELDLPEGYGIMVNGSPREGFLIINPHTPEETEATVRKVWKDSDDNDGMRPASISVQLMADGKAYGEPAVLNAENGWTLTITGLPKYDSGKEIRYTWEEKDIPDGYALSDSIVEGTVTTLTNTYTPEIIEIEGVKIWAGETDKDNQRPASVTIRLYADGVEIDHVTVTAETDWTFKFGGLKKFKDGAEIRYTITEDPVVGYIASIDGFKVTNTWEPPQEAPQTSDRAVFPAIVMLLTSAAGFAFAVTRRRRRSRNA